MAFSCDQRRSYFEDVVAYDCFVAWLERMRLKHEICVLGYVFMPEHLHLLVSEPRLGLLADAMKMFKLSVALRQQRRPFWQKRYYDGNLYTHGAMIDCLRYIHRNPLKRQLVTSPEAWRWSSYRHYFTGETCPVQLDAAWAQDEPRWTGPSVEVATEDPGELECESFLSVPEPTSENPDMGHRAKRDEDGAPT